MAVTSTMVICVDGVLVAVCSGTGSTELFAVHAGCFVLKTRDVTTIVLSTCKLFRTTVLPVALASFVARPLSDGCRLACRRTPCCIPSRASAFRWLLMLHAFGPSVLSAPRWRAFRPIVLSPRPLQVKLVFRSCWQVAACISTCVFRGCVMTCGHEHALLNLLRTVQLGS